MDNYQLNFNHCETERHRLKEGENPVLDDTLPLPLVNPSRNYLDPAYKLSVGIVLIETVYEKCCYLLSVIIIIIFILIIIKIFMLV